jgi:hypothetical protein
MDKAFKRTRIGSCENYVRRVTGALPQVKEPRKCLLCMSDRHNKG